jgi:hypothetical protein
MLKVQIFRMNIRFGSFYYVHVAGEMTFVQKTRAFNVDEIDTWGQFHQHFTRNFYARRSQIRKKRQSSQQCHLALLGLTSVKAVHINVGEIDS